MNRIELSLSLYDFNKYISAQLNHFFPDNQTIDFQSGIEKAAVDIALDRTGYCFTNIALKSYNKNGSAFLNHLHSDQYAVFLWFLSNSVWNEKGDIALANKIFYLNKSLHGFSCMYDTKLPDIFLLFHTVGTVLGKAQYSDYLVAAQGSTVGAQNGIYPKLGKGVSLLPYSSIVGECTIGDRVSVGIGASVYKRNVENGMIVFKDENGAIGYKAQQKCWAQQFFLNEI